MSQEHTAEKKNRFQISREVQEEFVNSVAANMLALAETAGKWQKPWVADKPLGMPFCATTGREYGGANMVKLMLTSIVNGYNDDRWMTFKQFQQIQADHPARDMKVKKGVKGTKLLRPEEITFIVKEDGKWEYLTDKQIKEFAARKEQGLDVPDVQRMTLFYPFTVFNAAQIDGFPPKEQQAQPMTPIERNDFVERFIACTGIPVEHHTGDAYYEPKADTVKMPFPERFISTEEYYASKLHETYHATGHAMRENRKEKETPNIKNYAFEEMRAEMFSMLAGARFDLPMPESNSSAYINKWNQTFSGGDAKAVFQAAAEAAKVLTIMHQFEMGEQPKAQWFPRSENWPGLIADQVQRDAACGAHMPVPAEQVAARSTDDPMPRPAPLSFEASAAAFQEADNPLIKARIILQNPDFLEMALKQDAATARSLASLCDSFAQTLSMELDEKNRAALAPTGTEAPATRMRM
ncbi:zincin-like metallopeptidase domain-containing protein [Desulfovibrio sp. 86]|uniref:DUF1738 domain-containing protein n=1 Tax=uncultured Desulfovibrio sp. TaxID=167968 RepID=A0A212KX98_9BACT|nr:zincin-like metallopeptidase domain-containing protein [Desulfovibrio sp. 86]SCM69897.1 conserved hypothetical protein [uncultured Desulfovibrio sp.]VZH35232.1 conserved protein of unknown function [Desulfovibrio sp. 86]